MQAELLEPGAPAKGAQEVFKREQLAVEDFVTQRHTMKLRKHRVVEGERIEGQTQGPQHGVFRKAKVGHVGVLHRPIGRNIDLAQKGKGVVEEKLSWRWVRLGAVDDDHLDAFFVGNHKR